MKLSLSDDQQQALNLLQAGQNVFLTGKAGTGKSFVIHQFLRKKRNVLKCAPTGIAALAIDGATLHKTFRLGFGMLDPDEDYSLYGKQKQVIEKAHCLIIDEISMCRADVFEAVAQKILSVREDLQIIVVGDFFQLPPVVKDHEREFFNSRFGGEFAFNAPAWGKLNFRTVELETVHRQRDEAFIHALNKVRSGDAGGLQDFSKRIAKPGQDTTILTTTNRTAEQINSSRLKQLKGPEYRACADKTEGFQEKDFPVPFELKVKPGALVIACTNDRKGRYYNGQVGKVVDFNNEPRDEDDYCDEEEYIEVEFGGKTVMIERYQWKIVEYEYDKKEKKIVEEVKGVYSHFPLKLAWAITIHKSQGMSLSNVHVDLNRGAFAHGQTYVALSRAESLEGLTLAAPIKQSDLIVDQKVAEFITTTTTKPKPQEQTAPKGRGGARPGAGRKALKAGQKKEQVSVWLSPELLGMLDCLDGASRSKKIEQILIQQLGKSKKEQAA